MKNLLNGNTWMWERGKFMNRRYLMQDMYQKWLDGDEDDVDNTPQEEDPFWEPTEDVLIGTGNIFLQSLAYALDFDDNITISDYKVCGWVGVWEQEHVQRVRRQNCGVAL